ncbi:penicillin-binding transpeptidase domain-containing protein [Candidatus Latescibacterota bacterium]
MQSGPHITRQKTLMIILGIMWLVLAGKLVVLQVIGYKEYRNISIKQRIKPYVLEAQRGCILDRNGESLAVSRVTASYGISPTQVKNKAETTVLLSEATGKSKSEVSKYLASKSYVWLVRQANSDVVRKMDDLDITGIHKHTEFSRYYPLDMVGAQVIGTTDIDSYGIEGCELFFNDELMGRDGRSTVLVDAKRKSSPSLEEPRIKPRNGSDVSLTIDWRVQEIAEEELEACVASTRAKWAGAIVYDAGSGEILAMANVPRYNPNRSEGLKDNADIMRNRLVTDMVEPGSIYKVVIFSEAIESGVITEDDEIDCEGGQYQIYNHVVHDTHEMDVVSAREVLIQSSNIGTVKIAEMVGEKRLYERSRLMGFGEVTGIDLPYESPGRISNPRKWSKLSLPTISYGQGVAVSPLQIVTAYGAIANGGELMVPRIVRKVTSNGNNNSHTMKSQVIRRAMTPETSQRLTELLVGVVEEGTGKNAGLPHMRIAGKTGTAQKVVEGKRGYEPGQYISSFVGFLPDCRTKLVCLVMVDSPKGVYYGSQVAAPAFKNIINRTLHLDGVVHEHLVAVNDTTGSAKTVLVPNVRGKRIRETLSILQSLGLNADVQGDTTAVASQVPPAGTRVVTGSIVTIYSDSFSTHRTGHIQVPNLIGKTMREAVQNLVQVNLKVNVAGTGIVRTQKPRAGVYVDHNTICMIMCRKR